MCDMMMRLFLSLATVTLLTGCFYALRYTGDGQFTDHGIMAYSRRFVIDLGPVDLSYPGTYTYNLSGLPKAELVASIEVSEEDTNTWEKERSYPVVVHMLLQNAQGETVIDENGSLDSWIRSFGTHNNLSELYRSGEEREIVLPRGGTTSERVGLKSSSGWGTYFYSERNEKYRLSLTILESSMKRPARMIVAGWSR